MGGSGEKHPRAWIEIDINHTREAYQRACDFVAARNLAYGLTSNRLEELGGAEKRRVKEELFPSDFEWSSKGRICLRMPPERITFGDPSPSSIRLGTLSPFTTPVDISYRLDLAHPRQRARVSSILLARRTSP